jgi:hypothetical protein
VDADSYCSERGWCGAQRTLQEANDISKNNVDTVRCILNKDNVRCVGTDEPRHSSAGLVLRVGEAERV